MLQERSKVAHDFSEAVNDRVNKVRQTREYHEQEKLNSFIMKKYSKEKELTKKTKSKKDDFILELEKKKERRNVISNRLDNA